MSQSVFTSGLKASEIEAIDLGNVQCHLAAFECAYNVYSAATLEGESWSPARCRAILTDMRRCLGRELKKVDLSKSTCFELGLDLLVETLWETLSFPPGDRVAYQLDGRVRKASRILATLVDLTRAWLSMEALYPAFGDE